MNDALGSTSSTSSSATPQALTIMLQGTASDVGKSLLTTALCRILHQDGYSVAPFKSQNMSLNSYITPDGKEIGRAQGMQADACKIVATTNMNPILLKPTREMSSQVVVHGKPYQDLDARAYREHYLPIAETIVKDALAQLRSQHEVVVIEGAGSPAEINLKDSDIVNMRLAAWADAPVILVADIDRGGVFASVVGTMAILEPHERDRVCGIIINKFRGDVTLLQPGIDWLVKRIGKPVLGVIPYLQGLTLEDEDSLSLDDKLAQANQPARPDQLDIVVIRLPRISNFTDVDPLLYEIDVHIRYVSAVREFGSPDVVLIPGSKNTIADLQYLQQSGLADHIINYAARGGRIVGICGGYQMLGERLLDPLGIESGEPDGAVAKPLIEPHPSELHPSEPHQARGLGIFPMETVFLTNKITERVSGITTKGFVPSTEEIPLHGYEIHMGQTTFSGPVLHPFQIKIERDTSHPFHEDGAITPDGRIWGTYIHGVMHNDELRRVWLNSIRSDRKLPLQERALPFGTLREQSFDLLADHFRKHVSMERIYNIIHRGDGDS